MDSNENEEAIHKFFLNIIQYRNSLDISREVLIHQKEFNSYSIFRILDRNNKNRIDEYDISFFLK